MSEQRVKVLLVEDNEGDARLIQESLSDLANNAFDIEIADRLATALRRLNTGGIDAVLLDLALPDSQGQETFHKARAHAPTIPIIVLTGLGDDALAIKLVREGAQDYVAKTGLNGSILSRAIRYAIERERADQQLRQFTEELDKRVKTRTVELEAANKELEAFSYSVSHDLRAPLRHIDGYVEVLLENCGKELGAAGHDYVARIRQSVKKMGGTIDDLLKLASLGRQELELQTTSLQALVERVLLRLAPEIQVQDIRWVVGALQPVECDSGLMEQVLENLLSNAIKYTRRRAVAIIEIGQTTIDGQLVTFVRDNGAGFDMKYYDKLFGAFQRLHAHEEFEGTGVGLATVHRIIQRHGGRIWAESAVDHGATFYFTLGKPQVTVGRNAEHGIVEVNGNGR